MDFQSNVEKKAYDLSWLKKEILCASVDGETIYTLLRMAHSALQADICLCSTSLLILCNYPENQESFYFTRQGNTLLPTDESVQDFLASGIPERIVANPDEPFTARYHDT